MQSSNYHQTGANNTALESGAASFLARVKGILLSPAAEWPIIEREDTPPASVFVSYVIPLAALAAIVNFIRFSVVGINMPFGGTLRSPVVTGLTSAIWTCAMAVLGVALIAGIINLLAPTFGGTRDTRRALRTAAYSLTAAYVGTFLGLLPMGTLLSLLAGLYGIYTLYLGLPLMMRSKPEKAGGYTASVVVCTILTGLILGALSASLGVGMGLGRGVAFNGLHRSSDQAREAAASQVGNAIGGLLGTDQKGKEDIGAAISNLAKAGEQMEQQERRAAAARAQASTASQAATASRAATASPASTDPPQNPAQAVAAAGSLASALGGALGGAHRHTPVDFHQLENLLPASLPGMSRQQASGSANQALGIKKTSATATYQGAGNARAEVEISDAAAVSGLIDMADALNVSQTSETDSAFEKDVSLEGRKVHEKYDRNARHGEIATLVARRFAVSVSGDNLSIADLEGALSTIDLKALEAMKDAGATE
jgi:energy-converting hydrogenase Eha subunit A